jgi:hypothetical protein
LKKIDIKIKNLFINPIKGGTPARDNNNNIRNTVTIGILLNNFNSFKVLNDLLLNIKKIKNIFNVIIIYIITLNNNTEY